MTTTPKVKGIVDIVFLVDATGSMQPCIEALKNNIMSFIATLSEKDGNGECSIKDWRAKVVGYRDYANDRASGFEDNLFVKTPDDLRAQLGKLQARGGGDEPESLLDALYEVARMGETPKGANEPEATKWRYKREATRCVIVFTDASFHETMEVAKPGGIEDVINEIHSNRLILFIFAPDMECHHKLAAADKSEYHAIPCPDETTQSRQQALVEFTADRRNFEKTMEMLAKSVSKSIEADIL